MLPKYKDIIDLIKKGSTIEAQEKIMTCQNRTVFAYAKTPPFWQTPKRG